MSDEFLSAFWGPRREPVEECARRLESSITQLGAHSELLRQWYGLGLSRAEAQGRPIAIRRDALVELLLKGRSKRDDNHKIIEEAGVHARIWNGADDDLAAVVDVTCACSAQVLGVMNNFGLDLPMAATPLVELSTTLALLRIVVEAWDPDWAVVTTQALREAQMPKVRTPFVGWLTYLSPGRGDPGAVKGAAVERFPDGGAVIVLAPRLEEVDVGHALRVAETLRVAGVLRPTPIDRAVVETTTMSASRAPA